MEVTDVIDRSVGALDGAVSLDTVVNRKPHLE